MDNKREIQELSINMLLPSSCVGESLCAQKFCIFIFMDYLSSYGRYQAPVHAEQPKHQQKAQQLQEYQPQQQYQPRQNQGQFNEVASHHSLNF